MLLEVVYICALLYVLLASDSEAVTSVDDGQASLEKFLKIGGKCKNSCCDNDYGNDNDDN